MRRLRSANACNTASMRPQAYLIGYVTTRVSSRQGEDPVAAMAELDDLTSAQLYGWLRSRLNEATADEALVRIYLSVWSRAVRHGPARRRGRVAGQFRGAGVSGASRSGGTEPAGRSGTEVGGHPWRRRRDRPVRGSGRRKHEAITGSSLHVIVGDPHGCDISHAEEFNRIVVDFLGK